MTSIEVGDGARSPERDPPDLGGLSYVSDQGPGIRRRRVGRGFVYKAPDGSRLTDAVELVRISRLAIPPAYVDVWISPDPNGHIQATARDARGRKQYRYHPDWGLLRDAYKFERLIAFAEGLPELRSRVGADMARPGLSRDKVLATVAWLLETTLIRIGNLDYVRQNDSYGLTTLLNDHVDVTGSELRFRFEGKSGKTWRLRLRDRRIARVVRSCQELPGQALFQYVDEDGEVARVTSTDVNAYLRRSAGGEISAKDFRTWAATVTALDALATLRPIETKKGRTQALNEVLAKVAARLGNTPAITRKSYVHPDVIERFLDGSLTSEVELAVASADTLADLRPEERRALAFLKHVAGERRSGQALPPDQAASFAGA